MGRSLSSDKKILSVFWIFIFILSGCTVTKPSLGLRIETEKIYDSIYPHYVEICAVSQLTPRGSAKGGRHGHAAMYLKGVCRDESAAYPKIKVCDEGAVDLTDPESGVGVSVNKMFKTVNWVAVPGKKLFLHGDLSGGEVLNHDKREEVVRKALRLGLFNGVELHPEYMTDKPADMSDAEWGARQTIATDYAIKFGRSAFCSRIPVTRPMLEKAVLFLNELNHEYASGKEDYHWSGYSDNCAHTVHNALANAGVWKRKSVRQFKLRQLLNVAVPANEFVDLSFLSNLGKMKDFKKIKRNKTLKNSLMNEDWLPMRHGALLNVIPVHSHNELYDTQFTIFLLDIPLGEKKSRKIRKMLADKRFTDIKSNLHYFETQYQEAAARFCESGKKHLNQEKEAFRTAYCEYLEAQTVDVRDKLEKIRRE